MHISLTAVLSAVQATEIEERRIQSCVHFMTLKKLNRLAHIRLKKGRDQTHEVWLKAKNWGGWCEF